VPHRIMTGSAVFAQLTRVPKLRTTSVPLILNSMGPTPTATQTRTSSPTSARGSLHSSRKRYVIDPIFSGDVIYTSCAYAMMPVRLPVCLSLCDGSVLAHYSKFRFQIPIPLYRALAAVLLRPPCCWQAPCCLRANHLALC